MRKICFILGNYFKYYKGGAELQAYFISKILNEYYKVHFIFVNPPNYTSKNKIPKIDEGIVLHGMKRYHNKLFGRVFFLNFHEILNIIKKINPDIVYQRGGKPYLSLLSKRWRKEYKNLIFGISMDTNCSKTGILGFNKNIFQYPSKIIDGFFTLTSLENANIIVAQTKFQQQLISRNFKKDSIIIPNGHHVPSRQIKKFDPPIISWIANIKAWKQPEIFINLAEKCKNVKAHFIYAGRPANGEYQKILLRMTKKISNLTYLGEIPFEKTNQLLAQSSLFINTSLKKEGFPNTYIQSWMRETPVITLNFDPDNIIKNNNIGFHSKNFERLVKDTKFLIENPDKRKMMGKRARDYAVKNHDINLIGKRYLKLFENLLKR
jgi:glycosyltransferase involved in cell wall biosynthesis